MDEEFPRGLIENWPAQDLLAAGCGDECFIQKGFDHTAGVDSANLLNFRDRNRLFIGNYSQSFEGSERQSCRWNLAFDEVLQHLVMFGLRRESIPVRNLTNLNAAFRYAVLFYQFVQLRFQLVSIDIRQRFANRVEADRLLREIY